MTASLTITMSPEVLEALRASKAITIALDAAGGRAPSHGRRTKAASAAAPRAGSLPARVLEWASARGKPFGNPEVEKQFRLSRAHASMLMSTLANGPYAIRRTQRGVYEYSGRSAAPKRKTTKKRK